MKVRTRFAPSPTGYLHVGGVRTALFAWLVARQAGGQFILRIEDTDRARHVENSEQHIMDSLRWLGLQWDGGPYRQSERLEIYKEWAQKLIDKGRAYADPYSATELEALRQKAIAGKRPFLFRDHRPENPPPWDGSQPLRFRSNPTERRWEDAVLGELKSGPEAIDDFILVKSDGYPTYNFAHVIDDNLMEISHVIRSQEFLPSVPKFLDLYEAMDVERPVLATLPYVMGPDGQKKLSKRDGAKDILDYRRDGYLPEALINFLATLGWNDGTKQEVFSVDELTAKFDLGRVQRGGARFDEQRLIWLNSQHIAKLSDQELLDRVDGEGLWDESRNANKDYKLKVTNLIKSRIHTLAEVGYISSMFFNEPKSEAVSKLMDATKIDSTTGREMLSAAKDKLSGSSFSEADIKARLNDLLQELDTKPAVLFTLIRIAISGEPYSPELFGSLAVLGKQKSLARLGVALKLFEKTA